MEVRGAKIIGIKKQHETTDKLQYAFCYYGKNTLFLHRQTLLQRLRRYCC